MDNLWTVIVHFHIHPRITKLNLRGDCDGVKPAKLENIQESIKLKLAWITSVKATVIPRGV